MEHQPVLLDEVERYLAIREDGVYCDCTLGAAGYAVRILSRGGRVITIDRDETALEAGKEKLKSFGDKVTYHHGSYGEIEQAAAAAALAGIVADLGFSRTQIEDPERGLSFQQDGPLDMRYDRSQGETAADILNHRSERELADLFYSLGGERRSRQVAHAVMRARPIRSTLHLAEVVESAVRRGKGRKIHPATRTFQALRIAVNDELAELDKLLEVGPGLLEPGGRLAIVSFHSLEDARVKRSFRDRARRGGFEALTKGVVRPSDEEVQRNPASRSAKLRVLSRGES